jgi:hypothetical protein
MLMGHDRNTEPMDDNLSQLLGCAPVGHGEPVIEPESDGPGPLASSLAGTVGIVFPDGLGLSTIDLGCWLRTLGLGRVADFGPGPSPMVAHKSLAAHRLRSLGLCLVWVVCGGRAAIYGAVHGERRGGGHGLGHGGVGLGHGLMDEV